MPSIAPDVAQHVPAALDPHDAADHDRVDVGAARDQHQLRGVGAGGARGVGADGDEVGRGAGFQPAARRVAQARVAAGRQQLDQARRA